MTQRDLAKAAATSLRNVQRAEAGEEISPQMAQFFADALRRDLAELVAQGSLPTRQRTADRLARLAVRTPTTPPKKGDVESSRLHDWTYAVTKVEAADAPQAADRRARARGDARTPEAKARRLR